MTRRILVLAALAIAALPVYAQPPDRGPGGFGGGAGRGVGRLDFLAGYLALTDAQKTQAKTIFDAADQASETARGQLMSARNALQAAVKANSSDADLDRLAAAVGTIQGQLEGIQARASAKFYALLTAEQKAKYEELGARSGPGRRP